LKLKLACIFHRTLQYRIIIKSEYIGYVRPFSPMLGKVSDLLTGMLVLTRFVARLVLVDMTTAGVKNGIGLMFSAKYIMYAVMLLVGDMMGLSKRITNSMNAPTTRYRMSAMDCAATFMRVIREEALSLLLHYMRI